MSINNAHAGKDGVLLFNTERILIFSEGVKLSFSDSNDPHFKGSKSGKIYLTTHRVVFVNSDKKEKLLSLSMPFHTMKSLKLEQPVFGANYISGKVFAEQGGGWNGQALFKLSFNKGGAIEFGRAMLKAGSLASKNPAPQTPYFGNMPPGPFYQAPPPAYTPPEGGMYGFVPYSTFPNPPPDGSVFMMNGPPPYPGVDPTLPPYPFAGQPVQDPYNPHGNNVPFSAAQGGYPQQPYGPSQYGGSTEPFGGPNQPPGSFGGPNPPPGSFGGPNQPPGSFGGPNQPPGSFGGPNQPPGPYNNPNQPPGSYGPSGSFGVPQYPSNAPYNPHSQPSGHQATHNPQNGPPQNPSDPSAPIDMSLFDNNSTGTSDFFSPSNQQVTKEEQRPNQASVGGQGYYDPQNPQNLYLPPNPPQYGWGETSKKNN